MARLRGGKAWPIARNDLKSLTRWAILLSGSRLGLREILPETCRSMMAV